MTATDTVKDAVIAHWNRRAADFDSGPTHGLLNPAQDSAWRALRAWRELLRPGGRVALVEGAWWDMVAKDEYTAVHDRLPLFGGRPAEQLIAPLRDAGFEAPEVIPLMDAALWVEPPTRERYLIVARRPA